jgi:hypothetical protein
MMRGSPEPGGIMDIVVWLRSLVFKHALVQDAAYMTLLKGRRQHLHTRIVGNEPGSDG